MDREIYVILGGKIKATTARISGEYAYIALPFGQEKTIKFPRWQASQADAQGEIDRRKLARVERARKIVAGADSTGLNKTQPNSND